MTPIMLDLLLRSLWETVLMTGASGIISLVAGLPLGLALVLTARGGIAENLWINRTLGAVIKERDDLDLVRANLEEIVPGG